MYAEPGGVGGVHICAVDERGNRLSEGTLLEITSDGTVLRHAGISNRIGIPLTADGKMQIF